MHAVQKHFTRLAHGTSKLVCPCASDQHLLTSYPLRYISPAASYQLRKRRAFLQTRGLVDILPTFHINRLFITVLTKASHRPFVVHRNQTHASTPNVLMFVVTTGEKEKRTSKKNVDGMSTSSHYNKKFRTRSVEKQRGMVFGFRKTATAVVKPDGWIHR